MSSHPAEPPGQKGHGLPSWGAALAVYLNRRVLVLLFLGFSSGLPLLLIMGTLAARLMESDISLASIGFFSLVSAAYGFKFVWSPLIDRLPLPILGPLLGQRRSWMAFSQIVLMVCMVGVGHNDPAQGLLATAVWAVALCFASATQDIALDAFRVESLPEEEMGAGAGIFVLGYRLGMVVAGGGALILADYAGWAASYTCMAALMLIGLLSTLLCSEPSHPAARSDVSSPDAEGSAGAQPGPVSIGGRLKEAIIDPLQDFFQRPGWLLIIAFIAFYKYGDALLSAMATPFYLDIGFTKTEIGVASKVFGFAMTVIGGLLGGVLVARLGILRALVICGILQALSNLAFVGLAMAGNNMDALMATVAVENFTSGMGAAAFVAYLSSLCNLAYTATQYALVSSLAAFARTFLASSGGVLAEHLGWVHYFLLTTAAAIPGLALLAWMMYAFARTPAQTPVESGHRSPAGGTTPAPSKWSGHRPTAITGPVTRRRNKIRGNDR